MYSAEKSAHPFPCATKPTNQSHFISLEMKTFVCDSKKSYSQERRISFFMDKMPCTFFQLSMFKKKRNEADNETSHTKCHLKGKKSK